MNEAFLEIPSGQEGQPVRFDLQKVYYAESRLPEIRGMNIVIAADLKATFLEAHADTLKYLSVLRFRILTAKRQLDIASATALLDKFPDYADHLKGEGRKENEDIRKAFCIRDADVLRWREVVDGLTAATTYMENKERIMDRAYWECRVSLEEANKLANGRPLNQGALDNSTPMMPIGQRY